MLRYGVCMATKSVDIDMEARSEHFHVDFCLIVFVAVEITTVAQVNRIIFSGIVTAIVAYFTVMGGS